jgi:hypothetical protein
LLSKWVNLYRYAEDILSAIRDEIKQTDQAMRNEFWQEDKDVYNIWPPPAVTQRAAAAEEQAAAGDAGARRSGRARGGGGGGEGKGGGGADAVALVNPGEADVRASHQTVSIKTKGVKVKASTRDYEKAAVAAHLESTKNGGSGGKQLAITGGGGGGGARGATGLPFKTFRDLAALETGYIPAMALRLKYMHEFFVKAIFLPDSSKTPEGAAADGGDLPGGGDEARSDGFVAGDVVMQRMPLELFLRIAGCPPRLAEESPETLARLQSLAIKGALLGDMDSEASRAVLGDASTAQMKAVFKGTEQTLSKLIRVLHAMELIGRSSVSEAAEGGSNKFHHHLSRVGRFQPSPEATDPSEWVSFQVDSLEGHAAYWDALEAAFKSNHVPFKLGRAPVNMQAAFPNDAVMRVLSTGSHHG